MSDQPNPSISGCSLLPTSEESDEGLNLQIDEGDMGQELETAASELQSKIARRDEEVGSLGEHFRELLESLRELSRKFEPIETPSLSAALNSYFKLSQKVENDARGRQTALQQAYLEEIEDLKKKVEESLLEADQLKKELGFAKDLFDVFRKDLERVLEPSSKATDVLLKGEVEPDAEGVSLAIAADSVKSGLEKIALEMDDLREKARTLSSESCSLRSSLGQLEKVNVELGQSNRSLKDQNADLANLARKWQEAINTSIDMLESVDGSRRVQANPTEVDPETALEKFKSILIKFGADKATLEGSIKDLANQVNRLIDEETQNETKNASLVNELEEKSARICELEANLEDLVREKSSLEYSKEAALQNGRMLGETIAQMQEKFSKLMIERAELMSEIKELKDTIENLKNTSQAAAVSASEPDGISETLDQTSPQNLEEESCPGRLIDESLDVLDSSEVHGEPLEKVQDLGAQVAEQNLTIKNLLEENKNLKEKLVDLIPTLQEQLTRLLESESEGVCVSDQVLPWECRPELVGLSAFEIRAKAWDDFTFTQRHILLENCCKELTEYYMSSNSKNETGNQEYTGVRSENGSPSGDSNNVSPNAVVSILETPKKSSWRETRAERALLDETVFPSPSSYCQRGNLKRAHIPTTLDEDLNPPENVQGNRTETEKIKKPKLVLADVPQPNDE